MLVHLFKSWFGNVNRGEAKKFFLLGLIFALTIAINWLLRTLKDSAFITINGSVFIPHVKWASFLVSIPLVGFYNKLIDWFERDHLFYLACLFFGIGTLTFAYFLGHGTYGVNNLDACPHRITGWLWYVFVESFGSIMITLFWTIVADTTTPESAKKGYGIIALFGQIGNILGPLLVVRQAESWGTGILAASGAAGILLLIPLLKYFITVVDSKDLQGFPLTEHDTKDVDFAQGLGFLFSRPYVFGIFAIVCFYEIVYALFDYRFKSLAALLYQGEALTKYLGQFGVMAGIVAFVSLLLGMRNFTRWLGLTLTLTLSPLIMGLLTVLTTSTNITIIMWVMIIANALNYALHQPSKEQLYIPTSIETKYKAKAWIDIFGFRGSKAMGSGINLAIVSLGSYFMIFSTLASLSCVSMWFFIALFLGRAHKNAVNQNKVVC